MNPAFASQLGRRIWKANVEAQKIDGTTLEIYRIVVSTFSHSDKDDRERFYKKSFLLADVKLDTVLGMFFLIISNPDIDFQAWNLQWRSYTTGDILLTTRQVQLIEKKRFTAAALKPEHKVFVLHIAALSINSGNKVHPLKKA